ncbi:MAG: TlyA family RNA methyltransferase [Dehalococcoidia bacterium]
MPRIRADLLLVERGLAASREQAQRLIMAGRARVGTRTLVKPAELVDRESPLELTEPERYVSRGGHKLEAALDAFAIDVTGLACLDLGASTGGFTDCLLQRGAKSVLCVDVGRAQLHDRLRNDTRVTLLEGTNARALPELPPVDFFVADLSFISIRRVLPSVAHRVAARTPGVVLLKPQFEAGPANVSRGGIVRDEAVRARVLAEFVEWAGQEGWLVKGSMDSPVPGARGNVEFLIWLVTPNGAGDDRTP